MSDYRVQLKDEKGNRQFPVTTTQCVVDESGKSLDALLQSVRGGLKYTEERTFYPTKGVVDFFGYKHEETGEITAEERAYNIETYNKQHNNESFILVDSGMILQYHSEVVVVEDGKPSETRYITFLNELDDASTFVSIYPNGDVVAEMKDRKVLKFSEERTIFPTHIVDGGVVELLPPDNVSRLEYNLDTYNKVKNGESLSINLDGCWLSFGGILTEDETEYVVFDSLYDSVELGLTKASVYISPYGYAFIHTEELSIGGDPITVDSELSETSENPVQNKVIKAYVDTEVAKKQDEINDLEDIRSGASLGKTSLQEHQDISHLATKEELQNVVDDILENEEVYAAAVNDLNNRVTTTDTLLATETTNRETLQTEFQAFKTQVTENEEVWATSLTDINTRIDNNYQYGEDTYATKESLNIETQTINTTILDNEEVIAATLTDLNNQIAALNALITDLTSRIETLENA